MNRFQSACRPRSKCCIPRVNWRSKDLNRIKAHYRIAFLSLLLAAGCTQTRDIPETAFQALGGADRIQIAAPSKSARSISDSWRIRKMAKLLNQYRTGWQKPLYGSPVPQIIFQFRKGENLLESFGLGRGFITSGEGQFWYQTLKESDRQAILQLLQLKEST